MRDSKKQQALRSFVDNAKDLMHAVKLHPNREAIMLRDLEKYGAGMTAEQLELLQSFTGWLGIAAWDAREGRQPR